MPSLALGVSINSIPVIGGAHGTPAAPVFAAEDPVTIDGSGEAGTVHSVVLAYDDPQPYPPPQRTIQWKRDGVAILGATSASYTPVDTYSLTVTVSVTNGSGSDGPETSAAVNLTPGYTGEAVVTGDRVVGGELTVSTPTTIGTVDTVTYRVKRDGVQIATGNVYTATEDDEGHELTFEVLLANSAGTTVVVAPPVYIGSAAITVSVNSITPSGYTDLDTFSVDYDTTGLIDSVLIEWYDNDDPSTILATGNDVVFPASGGTIDPLKCKVTAFAPDGTSVFDISDDSAVVLQTVAPSVSSATIDQGGEEVEPGTVLNALVVATGSPAPTVSVQWIDDGSPISGATSAVYTIGAGIAGPITYSYVADNGVNPDATGSSSDSVTVATDSSPTLDLSGLSFDLADTDPIATDDLTARGTNLTGGVWALVLAHTSPDGTESIAFETGDYAFIDYKHLFNNAATQWTATGTSQSTNPFSGTPAALPTGFANSEQAGVLRAADTVADGSYSVKLWGGDGTTAVSVTATLVGAAPGAAGTPPAPPDGNWNLEDNADGRLRIVVVSPFPNGGSTNTDREYEVNSGSPVSFGVTGNGTFYITAAELNQGVSNSVRVRAVNANGDGDWSTAKTATPTGGTVPWQLTIVNDTPIWTGTPPASLTIVNDTPIWSA
jgi:hypothetical protein